jgi:hypothetical protein
VEICERKKEKMAKSVWKLERKEEKMVKSVWKYERKEEKMVRSVRKYEKNEEKMVKSVWKYERKEEIMLKKVWKYLRKEEKMVKSVWKYERKEEIMVRSVRNAGCDGMKVNTCGKEWWARVSFMLKMATQRPVILSLAKMQSFEFPPHQTVHILLPPLLVFLVLS